MASSDGNVHFSLYFPIDFDLWPIFSKVGSTLRSQIELVHIFGEANCLSGYFVTRDDIVYGVGRNDFGKLGIGDSITDVVAHPHEIEELSGRRVVCFASGSLHSLALTESGELFSWGSNNIGALGNGTILSRDSPGHVLLPRDVKIKAIAARSSYSLAVTFDNLILHWGDVEFTECSVHNLPDQLEFPVGTVFKQFACSALHASLLTTDSKVYIWGNLCETWGNEERSASTAPKLVSLPEHRNIVSIACSRDITVALNENGNIYILGSLVSLDLVIEAQKTLPILEIAGGCYFDSPIVFRMGDEGYLRLRYPYASADLDACELTSRSIQCAFNKLATPQVYRNSTDECDSRARRLQGPIRNIGSELYNIKEHSDLTVVLADGEIYVHKLILITFCEHFKAMLAGSWAQHHNDVLDMKAYNPRSYRAFLKYVYTGGLDIMQGRDLIDLYDIAQSYFENDLVIMCSEMFRKVLVPNSVAALYQRTTELHFKDLSKHLVEFTSTCLEKVILSEEFENLDPTRAQQLVIEAVKSRGTNGNAS